MKIDQEVIERLALEFTFTWRATLWSHVTSEVRQALIDSYCMDAIRAAQSGPRTGPISALTCQELINFCEIIRLAIEESGFKVKEWKV
jgi:hypothetical protein